MRSAGGRDDEGMVQELMSRESPLLIRIYTPEEAGLNQLARWPYIICHPTNHMQVA